MEQVDYNKVLLEPIELLEYDTLEASRAHNCQLGRLSLVSLAKAGMVEMVGDIALSAAMEWISHLFVLYMK